MAWQPVRKTQAHWAINGLQAGQKIDMGAGAALHAWLGFVEKGSEHI
jgi:cytochrome b